MSAWVIGLALAAGYLINKNVQVKSKLENAAAEYNSAAKPATDGVTSSELRSAWRNTDFTRFGDMSEDLSSSQKNALDQQVRDQNAAVEKYDAPSVPAIEGVLLTYDRCGY